MRHAVLARFIRSRQSHWRIHDRRELIFLRSAGCRGHGSIGGRSRPGYFCHQCLTNWLLQRQVVVCVSTTGFFLSNTTTGGTTSINDHKCHRSWGCCDTPQPTVTIIYVSGVAELTVVLRPADEGVPAPLFVCSAVDSDITGSSVDDVVVLSRCGNICFS